MSKFDTHVREAEEGATRKSRKQYCRKRKKKKKREREKERGKGNETEPETKTKTEKENTTKRKRKRTRKRKRKRKRWARVQFRRPSHAFGRACWQCEHTHGLRYVATTLYVTKRADQRYTVT
eukprot:scaffold20961_cov60-Phaeocystis_antarctica.AAC.1